MSGWKERSERSREAAARLREMLAEARYADVHRQYEAKLASDDPCEAAIAREILAAYLARDWGRLAKAKNRELLHVEWLPERRVRVMWPVPVPLTFAEMMILSYRRSNVLFGLEDDDDYLCFGFEVHDRDYLAFCSEQSRNEEGAWTKR